MSELESFYKIYDKAVVCLPPELRHQAHFTRCSVDQSDATTFYSARGSVLGVVDADGVYSPPMQGAKKKDKSLATEDHVKACIEALIDVLHPKIVGLRKEVAALADIVGAMQSETTLKSLNDPSPSELAARLNAVENEVAALADNGFRYRGFWRDGQHAKRGDAYTHDGSLWWASRDTGDRPCAESMDWSLAVRKGRDAR